MFDVICENFVDVVSNGLGRGLCDTREERAVIIGNILREGIADAASVVCAALLTCVCSLVTARGGADRADGRVGVGVVGDDLVARFSSGHARSRAGDHLIGLLKIQFDVHVLVVDCNSGTRTHHMTLGILLAHGIRIFAD